MRSHVKVALITVLVGVHVCSAPCRGNRSNRILLNSYEFMTCLSCFEQPVNHLSFSSAWLLGASFVAPRLRPRTPCAVPGEPAPRLAAAGHHHGAQVVPEGLLRGLEGPRPLSAEEVNED